MSRFNFSNTAMNQRKLVEMKNMTFSQMILHAAALASSYSGPKYDVSHRKFSELRAAFMVLEKRAKGSLFAKRVAKRVGKTMKEATEEEEDQDSASDDTDDTLPLADNNSDEDRQATCSQAT
jgi:hypothetical protein